MSTQLGAPAEPWELESDLASVANQAASELDNLFLGRKRVNREGSLGQMLGESITNIGGPGTASSRLNPATAAVLQLAINDSTFVK